MLLPQSPSSSLIHWKMQAAFSRVCVGALGAHAPVGCCSLADMSACQSSRSPSLPPHTHHLATTLVRRADTKSSLYVETIKKGDLLLNRVQKLSKVIDIE